MGAYQRQWCNFNPTVYLNYDKLNQRGTVRVKKCYQVW